MFSSLKHQSISRGSARGQPVGLFAVSYSDQPCNRAIWHGQVMLRPTCTPCDSDFRFACGFKRCWSKADFLESRADSSFKTSGHIATVTTAMNNALRRANKRQRNEQAAARVSAGGARRTTARGEARAGACRRARGAAACGRRKIVRGRRLVGREGRHDVARLGLVCRAWDLVGQKAAKQARVSGH